MDAAATAPPVVAVVVTHDPGPWFDEVLDSLAAQDYPSLRVLVLDAGSSEDITERVGARLPDAYVRHLGANPGYGAAADHVGDLVEGAAFYCFVHDDVAMDPGTVRLLVEETYRSNAGIVGPKLVEWDDERRLESVGFDIDKFGVALSAVEPGELDQEQHDAVRDAFFIPTPCLLVRADLFGALGGFDRDVPFRGDDLDLCWRAHIAGARVLVVPSARARHRSGLAERRGRDDAPALEERHRLRTVLSSYSGAHLLRVLPQQIVLHVVELVLALVTAKPRQARAIVGAWTWNLARLGAIGRKRAAMRRLREVPDGEIRRLQVRGSARFTTWLRGAAGRGQGFSTVTGAGRSLVNNIRSGARNASFLAWALVLVVFLFGSRALITGTLPAYGSLVRFTGSTGDLFHRYLSGWWPAGLGAATPIPTGVALVGMGGVLTWGALPGLRTLLVLGPLVVGFAGMWRLTRPLDNQAARITGLLVYAAVPLGYDALANGHWSGIVAYAVTPFVVARLARLSGLAPYGPVDGDPGPGLPPRSLLAQTVALGLVLALAAALTPAVLGLAVVVAVGIVIGSLLTHGIVPALRALAGAVGAGVVAFVLHVPWSFSAFTSGQAWAAEAAAPGAGPPDRGLRALAGLDVGPVGSALTLALVATALLALVVARGWRLAWAARAVAVALVALAVAWAQDRGWLGDAPLPPVEMLLAPVAAGVALSAALGALAFQRDVRGTRLSWRQPLAFAAVSAGIIGTLPVLLAATDGRWRLPGSDATAFIPADTTDGAFRVLWLGDPRALPLPAWSVTDGLGYAFSEDGAADLDDYWPGEPTRADERVTEALTLASEGQTARFGTLVAPTATRYVVVPRQGAPASEDVASYPPPETLLTTLASQLDLRRVDLNEAFTVYENMAWIPQRAVLSPGAAGAATGATYESLIGVDLSGSKGVLTAPDGASHWRGEVPAGRVYVADQADERWQLEVDGTPIERQPAFGFANTFDVPAAGPASLRYDTPTSRAVLVALQALLWLVALRTVIVAAYRGGEGRVPARRRRAAAPVGVALPAPSGAPLITLPAMVGGAPGRHWVERPPPIDPLAQWADEPTSPVPGDGEALPEGVVPPEAPTLGEAEAELAAEDIDVVAAGVMAPLEEGDDPAHVVTDGEPVDTPLVWHDVDPAEHAEPDGAEAPELTAALEADELDLPWGAEAEAAAGTGEGVAGADDRQAGRPR